MLELEKELDELRCVYVTRSICDAAAAALRELADRGHHRISLPDLFVAACAADAAIGVLHYDGDFDTLSDVLEFESRWITPAGSVD